MSDAIFTNWTDDVTRAWATEPVRLKHRLHTDPLFSMAGLAELVDRYPREHYSLMQVGAPGERRTWREGEIGKMSGDRVIESIANGRMWLNLRNVSGVDKRFAELRDQLFGEIGERVPGFSAFGCTMGILISSPKAEVYYHMDVPGQSLWQIHGKKRVYVYPAEPPFRRDEDLERIALYQVEVDIPYNTSYDEHARVFEIEGGEMLHWPLNAPHRVENLDCLNVSMTTEYWTEPIRRSQMINLANGILRHKLGVTPRSRAINGAGFWAKAALQAGVKRAGLLQKARKERRSIEFQLDTERIGAIRDLAPVGR
ncbi:hypothetical protein [Hyphomicrobium sp.]|uniref:hypothetical protein n=1 Tax=Hyphomicrobium sp. TaxID=82 RepID=UPI003F70C4DE